MWEDPANKEGGRWLLTLDRFQRLQYLNQIWLEIMAPCVWKIQIGENTNENTSHKLIPVSKVKLRLN